MGQADFERGPGEASLDSTQVLLHRMREGDEAARSRLLSRYADALRRFGHGRLPARARSILDTTDIVQDTLLRVLGRLEDFEVRRDGSFFAYLKQALLNLVRDEARGVSRRPLSVELPPDLPLSAPGPVEDLLGRETYDLYEKALRTLTPEQQEAVQLRLEGACSFEQVAEAIGSPSANAARMVVSRALTRLAVEMHALRPS